MLIEAQRLRVVRMRCAVRWMPITPAHAHGIALSSGPAQPNPGATGRPRVWQAGWAILELAPLTVQARLHRQPARGGLRTAVAVRCGGFPDGLVQPDAVGISASGGSLPCAPM